MKNKMSVNKLIPLNNKNHNSLARHYFKAQWASAQLTVLLFALSGCYISGSAQNLEPIASTSASTTTTTTPPPTNCNFTPSTYMAATNVIGQPNMNSNTANQGLSPLTAKTIYGPDGISVANNKLFVGDWNTRYMVYNSLPSVDNASADLVLGQASFSATPVATIDAGTTSGGREAVWTGSQLILADGWNGRHLVYNSFPTVNGQAADLVIGQPNMTASGGALAQNRVDSGYGGMSLNGNQLWLADTWNDRVITFDLPITANSPNATLVLGQPNFTTDVQAASATGFNTPTKPVFYNGKLVVSDRYNHRVLIFNAIPTSNQTAADVVIGQPNLTSGSANQGLAGPTAKTLNHPHAVAVDSVGRLYISDTYNNRVLVYNSIPTTNNVSADYVIGQPDFVSGAANAGGAVGAKTLSRTTDLTFYDCALIIGDQSNNRVLIYK